ncbi:MAG: CBS domain-containing protein [Candidatus Altiarchaeales archaeon]|nr:MAG: CBS domain-containing protein [Candidatus Altiarchaeales archaeon]
MTEIRDIMTKDVITINHNESVLKAAEMMSDLNIGCLVVEIDNKVCGIITERDIITKVICRNRNPKVTRVKEIMSSPLVTIHPLASLEDAVRIFNETGFKRLVVTSGDSLEGIVSTEDLIAAETRFIALLERYIQILKSRK